MRTQYASATVHVMIRLWREAGRVESEEDFRDIYVYPELFLELPLNARPTEVWVDEALSEIALHEYMLPDKFEICRETIIYEAIGKFEVTGNEDYWGEYSEEYNFILQEWSCDVEE